MSAVHFLKFAHLIGEVGKVPESSTRKIQRLQNQRLVQLISHAKRYSPFYEKKLRGISAESSIKAFQQIPPTSKDELQDNFDDVLTDRRLNRNDLSRFVDDQNNLGKWYQGRYVVAHTSGSLGRPLIIVQNRKSLGIVLASMTSRCRPTPPPTVIEGLRKLIRPPRVAVISFKRGFYPSGVTLEFMKEYFGPLAKIKRFSSIQPDLVDQLNDFQPQVISGYASVLEALAIQRDALHLRNLENFTNSSEQLSPRARNRIEQAFGVPIFDHYGAGECLQMADGCRHCGQLHVNSDWVILESVDDEYRPVPSGVIGSRVLVTNLANHTQPFIRYELPDRLALESVGHNCPNLLPRIARIEGRSADLFWLKDGSSRRFVSGVLFHTVADSLQVVREWQAVLHNENQIQIRVVLLTGVEISRVELEAQMISRLYQEGMPRNVDLEVQVCREILPDSRTGKMKRMVNRFEDSSTNHSLVLPH